MVGVFFISNSPEKWLKDSLLRVYSMETATKTAPKTAIKCKHCEKSFKNLTLHVVKTHKLFICCSCEEYKPVDEAITGLGGKKEGKIDKHAMCTECFT